MPARHRGTEAGRKQCTNPVHFQCLGDAKFPSRLWDVPHGRALTPTSARVGFLHAFPRNQGCFHLLFAETVTYKDLCLTCLSERSIKGTDSQMGCCLPSIPAYIFLRIINRAGSYHQSKVNLMKQNTLYGHMANTPSLSLFRVFV